MYVLQFDGGSSSNPGPSGFGALLINPEGIIIEEYSGGSHYLTNNEAEYNGLVLGLEHVISKYKNTIEELCIQGDSSLVINQMSGKWKVSAPNLKPYHQNAIDLSKQIKKITYQYIPRKQNTRADSLTWIKRPN